jgi:hypothetical protein
VGGPDALETLLRGQGDPGEGNTDVEVEEAAEKVGAEAEVAEKREVAPEAGEAATGDVSVGLDMDIDE